MPAAALSALLPLMIVAVTALVVLLVIAFWRQHLAIMGLTLSGCAAAFATLPWMLTRAPQAIPPLLMLDAYSVLFLALLLLASAAVTALAYGYLAGRAEPCEEWYLLVLLATLGAMLLVMSTHFISLFLGLELLSVSLYALLAYQRRGVRPLEAGIKYLLLAGASSAFLLFGMALLYAAVGTMQLSELALRLAAAGASRDSFVLMGLALFLTGLGFKLAVVPFHMWTPDIYEGAPVAATAFIATVSKGAVVALLLRYLIQTGAFAYGPVLLALGLSAVASMVVGNVLALLQSNVKRLLAYSSIAQLGYLLVALVTSGPSMAEAVAFYLVAYMLSTLCAFGSVLVLSSTVSDAEAMESYRGLGWRHPGIALVFSVGLLSLAGIPLTAGFLGKFYVLAAGVESALWPLVMLVALNSALGLFYYLRLIATMYAPLPQVASGAPPVTAASWSWAGGVALTALTVLVVWLGVYPAPFLILLRLSVASIM